MSPFAEGGSLAAAAQHLRLGTDTGVQAPEMKVSVLVELLQRQNPDATVVVCDTTDFVRAGIIRPLSPAEVQPVQFGEVLEDDGRWVCEWTERSVDSEGPIPGLLLGPR